MDQLLISNARMVLTESVVRGSLLVRDGRIAGIFPGEPPVGLSSGETLDVAGAYVAPGLSDVHIHGSAGVDVMRADSGELSKLSKFLLGEGVTGYFPTLVPTDTDGYLAALSAIDSFREEQSDGQPRGARVLGVHFEGPFVSKNRCGALHPEHFRSYDGNPASLDLFTREVRAGYGQAGKMPALPGTDALPGLMTLAPEIQGGIGLISELTSRGVRAFIGHTQ